MNRNLHNLSAISSPPFSKVPITCYTYYYPRVVIPTKAYHKIKVAVGLSAKFIAEPLNNFMHIKFH